MEKTIITSVEDFCQRDGQQFGVSGWIEITQNVINNFADVTYDHQWIHVDTERAKKESSYGCTIAHGYLTLSLLPHLLDDIIEVRNLKQLVNYGIEKMTYKSVVPSGSRIRLNASLKSVKDLGEACMTKINCIFEIEGQDAPALEGTIIYVYYFNQDN